jgi:neutral ceramidase
VIMLTRRYIKAIGFFLVAIIFSVLPAYSAEQADSPENYLIGVGRTDITGPAYGVQLWGFAHAGQLSEGIHFRTKSRAFIAADPVTSKRFVFVSIDIGSIEHSITLEVIDRLQERYGNLYSLENVALSATHTHSSPVGYWHTRTKSFITGDFYQEYFELIVDGIVDSIAIAHDSLQPGTIRINKGDVKDAGINRSLIAYEQNPQAERDQYSSTIDKAMTLLKFSADATDIGMFNWHAVHPTSMTFDNRLISGDHKGYAALEFERVESRLHSNPSFVGAFAQANPGDVTSNLNLDNTGPGANDFESTKIIGDRQLATALALFDAATEVVKGKIDHRQIYIDLSDFLVADEFTHAGEKSTCPSAYGYPFFGGSTEDGGGNFLFSEGMTEQSVFLDFLVRVIVGTDKHSDDVKQCQHPKAILMETGTGSPPLQTQIRSISLFRLGQLVIIAVPAEVTTMAGRRLRDTVMAQLGDWAKYAVIAGYSNGFAGYVTTAEEYRIQQYEGGHTLHGPWSLAAYQQTGAWLAQAIEAETPVVGSERFDDWRGKTPSTELSGGKPDKLPEGSAFGDVVADYKKHADAGETLTVRFWTSNPTANIGFQKPAMAVEVRRGDDWVPVFNDDDWSTKMRWSRESTGFVVDLIWSVPEDVESGDYRIRHFGQAITGPNNTVEFEGTSETLSVSARKVY